MVSVYVCRDFLINVIFFFKFIQDFFNIDGKFQPT